MSPSGSTAECLASGGYTLDGPDFTTIHEVICSSPRWNESYYFSLDIGSSAVIEATFRAVSCPDGWTGNACNEPLYQFKLDGPSVQSFSGLAEAGAIHVYFDIPANNWNASLIVAVDANTTHNARIFLREAAISSYEPQVYGIYPESTSGYFTNSNMFDATVSYQISSVGMASTPFERYRPRPTRWVFSYICNSGSCDYSLDVFTTDSEYPVPERLPPAPSTPLSAPIGTPQSSPSSDTPTPPSETPTGGVPAVALAPVSVLVALLLALAYF